MNERLVDMLSLMLTDPDTWEDILRHGWWVPLDEYLAKHAGETAKAVYNRRSNGIWEDGVHSKVVQGGGLWVNLLAVNAWAAKSELRLESRSGRTKAAND